MFWFWWGFFSVFILYVICDIIELILSETQKSFFWVNFKFKLFGKPVLNF